MAYKGISYENGRFKLMEYDEPDAEKLFDGLYATIEYGEPCVFVVRNTKEEVEDVLMSHFKERISTYSRVLENYKMRLENISNKSCTQSKGDEPSQNKDKGIFIID